MALSLFLSLWEYPLYAAIHFCASRSKPRAIMSRYSLATATYTVGQLDYAKALPPVS